jgi:hypothetical protein
MGEPACCRLLAHPDEGRGAWRAQPPRDIHLEEERHGTR